MTDDTKGITERVVKAAQRDPDRLANLLLAHVLFLSFAEIGEKGTAEWFRIMGERIERGDGPPVSEEVCKRYSREKRLDAVIRQLQKLVEGYFDEAGRRGKHEFNA